MESDQRTSAVRIYEENLASIYGLVYRLFNDEEKARIWLRTPNPMLGGASPREMVRMGRYDRLLRFVTQTIEEGQLGPRKGQISRLDPETEQDVEEAWMREIDRRAVELDAGAAETIAWETVRARLRTPRG